MSAGGRVAVLVTTIEWEGEQLEGVYVDLAAAVRAADAMARTAHERQGSWRWPLTWVAERNELRAYRGFGVAFVVRELAVLE